MLERSASDARQNFSEIVNLVAYGGERVIIQRHGKELAAVIPIADVALLRDLESHVDLADARLAVKEIQDSGSVSMDELKQKLGYRG